MPHSRDAESFRCQGPSVPIESTILMTDEPPSGHLLEVHSNSNTTTLKAETSFWTLMNCRLDPVGHLCSQVSLSYLFVPGQGFLTPIQSPVSFSSLIAQLPERSTRLPCPLRKGQHWGTEVASWPCASFLCFLLPPKPEQSEQLVRL